MMIMMMLMTMVLMMVMMAMVMTLMLMMMMVMMMRPGTGPDRTRDQYIGFPIIYWFSNILGFQYTMLPPVRSGPGSGPGTGPDRTRAQYTGFPIYLTHGPITETASGPPRLKTQSAVSKLNRRSQNPRAILKQI